MSLQQVCKVWQKKIGDGKLQQVLLALANRCDEFGGNLYPSLDYLAYLTEMHRNTVRRHLKKLVEMGVLEVVQEATARTPALYVLNLDVLEHKEKWRGTNLKQSIDKAYQNGTEEVPKTSLRGTNPESRDTSLVPDPVINTIDPVNYTEAAGRLIEFLNGKTGKKTTLKNPNGELTNNAKDIIKILKKKYTEQDCKTVIARQWRLWKDDPKMKDYIRVSTIFRPSKFEEYLSSCV